MCEVGEVFTGFCYGFFGRDSYGEKRVEAHGVDWIVAREEGQPVFASFVSRKQKDEMVEAWRKQR